MTLYAELKAMGVPIANHESDLYFQRCPESLAILDHYPLEKSNSSCFRNQVPPHKGEIWMEVPFAFLPWWESRILWRVEPAGRTFVVKCRDNYIVANVGGCSRAEQKANAELIAAAPDLLAACKAACEAASDCLPMSGDRRVDVLYYKAKLDAIFRAAEQCGEAILKAERGATKQVVTDLIEPEDLK